VELEKNLPVPWRQTFPVSSCDGNRCISMKVEAVSDVEEEGEEDPLLISLPQNKAGEHVVSCMSVCILLHLFSVFPNDAAEI
jgi:hypothetical protein